MRDRVRGILVTDDGHFLTIKRIKPGLSPYWVLPGGGVEDGVDDSLKAASHREVREELAGEAEILALVHVLATANGREHFFLGRVRRWDFGERSGPEFAEAGRGRYALQLVPLSVAGIDSIGLRPTQVAGMLRAWPAVPGGVFAVPDLRMGQGRSTS